MERGSKIKGDLAGRSLDSAIRIYHLIAGDAFAFGTRSRSTSTYCFRFYIISLFILQLRIGHKAIRSKQGFFKWYKFGIFVRDFFCPFRINYSEDNIYECFFHRSTAFATEGFTSVVSRYGIGLSTGTDFTDCECLFNVGRCFLHA